MNESDASWVTDRRDYEPYVKEYIGNVGLRWEQLAGKRSLEIGSGASRISQFAKERGVDLTFLDWNFYKWKKDGYLMQTPGMKYVEGRAEAMPFQDNTFNLAFSVGGPPIISADTERTITQINETLRVLRPGGEFRFGKAVINPRVLQDTGYISLNDLEGIELRTFTPSNRKLVRDASMQFLQDRWPNVTIDAALNRLPKEKQRYYFKIVKPASLPAVNGL